jgi:hypothetical protein
MARKNKHAVAMQRLGQEVIRQKYGPDFWKQIRAGEKPSEKLTAGQGGPRRERQAVGATP